MAKRLPRPNKPVRVRLEWEEANMRALDMAAADSGLSVASFCRVALEMLTKDGQVTLNGIKEAVAKLGTEDEASEEKAAAKKPKK